MNVSHINSTHLLDFNYNKTKIIFFKIYNHIFANFKNFQKFHFLDKKLYFEGLWLGFINWKVNPSILGILQLLNQSFVFGNQAWRPRNEGFKFFRILKNGGFI